MRKLSEKEIATINRFIMQQSQLRRMEQMERAYNSSNALIDRIIHETVNVNPKLMARFMTHKAGNYNGLVHLSILRNFVKKLITISTKRISTIKEIEL